MAGMFYSLQEVCEKLGKSEDEVKQLVQEGKLREFRDGSNLLFKIEDVDALAGDNGGEEDVKTQDTSVVLSIDDSGELSTAPDELGSLGLDESDLEELTVEDTNLSDMSATSAKTAEDLTLNELTGDDSGISFDDESGMGLEELSGEDTKFASSGESINVLGGTEDGYDLTEDTSGETSFVGADDDEEELTLDKLDSDVNLDSFGGSGSGLLDLSLQADDTSLGAVLDDIYPEGGASEDGAGTPPGGVEGVGVVEEAEKIFETDEPVAAPMPSAAVAYAEPVSAGADMTFAISLFIGLLAMLYAGIIVIAAVKGISPSIMQPVQGIIWYIMAAAAGLVLIVSGLGAVMGKGPAKKSKKAAKAYKQKPKK